MKDARRKDSNAAREKGRKPENGVEKKKSKMEQKRKQEKTIRRTESPEAVPSKSPGK